MTGHDDYSQRFGGVGRLFGAAALKKLQAAHVCVVGVGGVGSWTVEGLARSGVGALTLRRTVGGVRGSAVGYDGIVVVAVVVVVRDQG